MKQRSSATTIASCWRNYGRISAILDFHNIPWIAVTPRVWQADILEKIA